MLCPMLLYCPLQPKGVTKDPDESLGLPENAAPDLCTMGKRH